MNEKKLAGLILITLIAGFAAYSVAQQAKNTADANANITNVFEIVVNNTDLGSNGTHERLHNVVYWTNNSPIAVYIIFHAVGSGASQSFDSNLSINGTIIMDRDFKTSAGVGQHDHFSFYTVVPKNSNYSVTNSSNIFSIEWREYPILSGRNGTLSVNQTVITQNISGGGVAAVQANSPLGDANQSGNITIFDNRTTYPNQSLQNQIYSINQTKINYTDLRYKVGSFTRDISLASGSQSVTGIGFKPSAIIFYAVVPGTPGVNTGGFSDATTDVGIYNAHADSANTWQASPTSSVSLVSSFGTNYQGDVTSFDSDGFTVTWTKTGSPTGTATIYYMAFR